MVDPAPNSERYRSERYRPQFHFSACKGWLNDPNGCVFYAGEYHLFFQHNPHGNEWGNMTWGHAISSDLVHWRELPPAILPYNDGPIFSGSAVVDWKNSSGLGIRSQPVLVALFTHARPPCGQALAYSRDRGRSWQLYKDGEYVVPNQGVDGYERDPKVFWDAVSESWVMVLWLKLGQVRFFNSPDLIHWKASADFYGEDFWECPDLFALPIAGDNDKKKWVLHDANFKYWVGDFDGRGFQPESGPCTGDYSSNFYAAQTWNDIPGRVVQIAWLRGGNYPEMPFNQQMSFPCELSLELRADGYNIYRKPVAQIEQLVQDVIELRDIWLEPGKEFQSNLVANLFDIEAQVILDPAATFSIIVYDQAIIYTGGQVACLGNTAPLAPEGGILHIRLLVDRTSIELFGTHGRVSLSACFLPEQVDTTVKCAAKGGWVQLQSLIIRRLDSAWK